MAKKRYGPQERHRQMRYEAYAQSLTLNEEYPQLEKLTIHMLFKSHDWDGGPDDQTKTFVKGSKAFFDIECPHRECIQGGFNLTFAVSNLVAKGQTESSGTIICQGWQDQERINKHRCLLELNYKIVAFQQYQLLKMHS